MKFKILVILLIFNFIEFDFMYAHSGRTDAKGGHYNRKTGVYHYHGSKSSLNRTEQDMETPPSPSYPVNVFSGNTAFPIQRIIDGDTVEIQYNGNPTQVRLIGVDTPETVHPEKPIEAFGQEAFAFTRNLLLCESVYLRFDPERTDKYGRLLAYLYRAPDGLFVNLEIIRQGYGYAYTQFPFKHMELFRHYESQAHEAKKGLWGSTTASTTPPTSSKNTLIQHNQDQQEEREVYITRTGKKYHQSGCRYLKQSQIAISLKDATKRYSPCSVSKPSQ